MPAEIKQARALNRLEVERLLSLYMTMSRVDLKAALEDESLPAIDAMIANIVYRGMAEGDQTRLNFLLDRLIGKVKEPAQEHNFNFHMLPPSQVVELGREAIRVLEAKKGEPE